MRDNPLLLIQEFRRERAADPNPDPDMVCRLRQRLCDDPDLRARLFDLVAQLSEVRRAAR